MERLRRSWSLLRRSIWVIGVHKKLLVFPALSALCLAAMVPIFLLPVAFQPTGHGYGEAAHWRAVATSVFTEASLQEAVRLRQDRGKATAAAAPSAPALQLRGGAVAYLAAFYFGLMFLATFLNTAFYHEILNALRGEMVSIRRGVGFAASRWKGILLWSLFAGVVGWLIKSVEERVGLLGRWIARFIGLAWSVASVFAVPVLVMEEETVNPLQVLRRSAETLKKAWGEALVGYMGIRLGGLILLLWSVVLLGGTIFLGAKLGRPEFMAGGAVLWIVSVVAFTYVLGVADQIYRGALYLFASTGQTPYPYNADHMALAWKQKRLRTGTEANVKNDG